MNQLIKWPKSTAMVAILAMLIVVLSGSFGASKAQIEIPPPAWTPVVASSLTPTAKPVLGADEQYHIVYELVLSNTGRVKATINQIDIITGDNPAQPVAIFTGDELLLRLRTLGNGPAENTDINPNETRLFLIDHAFATEADIPSALLHHFEVLGSSGPAQTVASPLSYTAAPIEVLPNQLVLGPPLKGPGWVAINGCCAPNVGHRSTGLPANGEIYFAQRFAIDWMRLDDQGRLAVGDLSDVQSYPSYGAEVVAVADGTVVQTLDTLSDQVPPELPDPNSINLTNVLGNNVILNLGNNTYALYAHLQPGSVAVQPGESVRQGQLLGKLGNTGNTSAPHLHLHIMSGPTLGSDGLPYTIDGFNWAGQIPSDQIQKFYSFEGDWNSARLPQPLSRQEEFPLFLDIVDFPG